jgi:hypothetical protein
MSSSSCVGHQRKLGAQTRINVTMQPARIFAKSRSMSGQKFALTLKHVDEYNEWEELVSVWTKSLIDERRLYWVLMANVSYSNSIILFTP